MGARPSWLLGKPWWVNEAIQDGAVCVSASTKPEGGRASRRMKENGVVNSRADALRCFVGEHKERGNRYMEARKLVCAGDWLDFLAASIWGAFVEQGDVGL